MAFNPIKETIDGKKANDMVWTTAVLNVAVKGLEHGKKLIANPFYENNVKLLKGDLVFERTAKEVEEWKRCKDDIIYFANTYCKLMTPTGIRNVEMRDYQQDYLKHLEKNRLSIFLSSRQSGKCNFFITNVICRFNDNFWERAGKKAKTKFKKYLVSEESQEYNIPLFEIYNIFDRTFKWKISYILYKALYHLDNLRSADA